MGAAGVGDRILWRAGSVLTYTFAMANYSRHFSGFLSIRKSLSATGLAVALYLVTWAADSILDELKLAIAWSWLDFASTALAQARTVGLGLVLIAGLLSIVVLARSLFSGSDAVLRRKLIDAPAMEPVTGPVLDTYGQSEHQARDVFQGEKLVIPNLVHAGDPFIRGKTFVDCEVLGPAIIEFTVTRPASYALDGCLFIGTDAVVYDEPSRSLSAISFEDCRFIRCTFRQVMLLFPAAAFENANRVISGLNWIAEPRLRSDPNVDPGIEQLAREIGGERQGL